LLARQEIIIEADGKEIAHKTLKITVDEALKEAGVELKGGDKVTPALTERVVDGMKVVIERAFPVQLAVDGSVQTIYTTRVPVKDVLTLVSLSIDDDDKVSPSLDSIVKPGCKIKVTRVEQKIIKEQYSIPASSEKKADSSLLRGQERVLQKGSSGEGERVIKVVYEDGKEVSRETVEERVLRPSVNKVIAYGTANVVSRGGNTLRYRRVFQARATAYGPSAGKYTATGAKAGRGSIAVDPRVIPLGTRLYVDGYGHGTANDVGGEIKGNAVDVYFPSDAECRRWGVRTVNVYILE
jgi:3D (Asp-Asp-Asp) domain-containing protein